MYEQFTSRARMVMEMADLEAQRFNHDATAPEHVLLAIVKEGTGVGANALRNLNVDLSKVRFEIEELIESGSPMLTRGKLPQTASCKNVREEALAISQEFGHTYVGSEHLSLALREVESAAQHVLIKLNVTTEELRAATLRLLGQVDGRS